MAAVLERSLHAEGSGQYLCDLFEGRDEYANFHAAARSLRRPFSNGMAQSADGRFRPATTFRSRRRRSENPDAALLGRPCNQSGPDWRTSEAGSETCLKAGP